MVGTGAANKDIVTPIDAMALNTSLIFEHCFLANAMTSSPQSATESL